MKKYLADTQLQWRITFVISLVVAHLYPSGGLISLIAIPVLTGILDQKLKRYAPSLTNAGMCGVLLGLGLGYPEDAHPFWTAFWEGRDGHIMEFLFALLAIFMVYLVFSLLTHALLWAMRRFIAWIDAGVGGDENPHEETA